MVDIGAIISAVAGYQERAKKQGESKKWAEEPYQQELPQNEIPVQDILSSIFNKQAMPEAKPLGKPEGTPAEAPPEPTSMEPPAEVNQKSDQDKKNENALKSYQRALNAKYKVKPL